MRVHFRDWTLDSHARELRHGGDAVHLSPKAFRLLEVLIEERPAALSKERLFEIVWPDTFVAESNLASLVKEIRMALRDDARKSTVIRTVHGYGYAFAAEATDEAMPRARLESIAVLPFANGSGSEWDYVSDGIAEALLNALTRLRSIRVVPRSTSFRYRSPSIDVKSVARDMRVEALITGRVAARDDAVTVQAELINAAVDSQIWGGRFHGRTGDLLHLQEQIEAEIITRLAEHAGLAEAVGAQKPSNEAYHLYLRGRHQWNRRDAAGFRQAIEAFRAASEMDPSFAAAHAALAEAYVVLGSREIYPASEIFPLARQAASRALAIDPWLSAAHSATAAVQELFEWDWTAAEASHRIAVSHDPGYASAAQWFALHFARRGVHDEATRWISRALDVEPFSPILNTNAALISYLARDFTAAVQQSETALDLAPHYEGARLMSGVAYIQIDPARAIEHLEEAARLSTRQPYTLSHLASAYAAAGRVDDARRIGEELRLRASTRYVSPVDVALVELSLGNRDAALCAFEAAVEQRSPGLSYTLSETRLDVLRGEPRFQSVLAAIGYECAVNSKTLAAHGDHLSQNIPRRSS
jgi:TolB-like protein/Tfp pilus assembly protein PilF